MSNLPPGQHQGWVSQAKKGNAAAYEQLYKHYSAPLYLYLIRLIGNEEDARDMVQETFLNAWKGLPCLQNNSYFKTWLYKIATNVAYQHLQKTRPQLWLSLEEQEQVAFIEDFHTLSVEDQVIERMIVQHALDHVSPLPRACMLLQIVGGFRQAEIADMLEKEVSHISTYVQRGLAQLSKAIALSEQQHTKQPQKLPPEVGRSDQ